MEALTNAAAKRAAAPRGGPRGLQTPPQQCSKERLLGNPASSPIFSPLKTYNWGRKNQAFLTRPPPKKIMGGKDEKACVLIALLFINPKWWDHHGNHWYWKGSSEMIPGHDQGAWRLARGKRVSFPRADGPGLREDTGQLFKGLQGTDINVLSNNLKSYF